MKKLVVFSGAGMSAESGIQTFRDADGLWEQHRLEDVATPEAWRANPDLVTRFYNERRKKVLEVEPNAAHLHLAQLEDWLEVHIVTQNIDDLHERAGSQRVLHLHGNIRKAKSSGPKAEKAYYDIDGWELRAEDRCPDGYRLRPHVVWFGEAVPAYEDAARVLEQADILMVIGTSLQVYPAAGLIFHARSASHKFIIDPKANSLDVPNDFIKIQGSATEGVLKAVEIIKKILA